MNSSLLRYLIIGCVVIGLLSGCASDESRKVSPERHPNLAAAQTFIEKAIDKLSAAERVHDFDLNGHAAKAKELLDEAYTEIKLAAEAADANR
jgi:uncharacterized protein YceK